MTPARAFLIVNEALHLLWGVARSTIFVIRTVLLANLYPA